MKPRKTPSKQDNSAKFGLPTNRTFFLSNRFKLSWSLGSKFIFHHVSLSKSLSGFRVKVRYILHRMEEGSTPTKKQVVLRTVAALSASDKSI